MRRWGWVALMLVAAPAAAHETGGAHAHVELWVTAAVVANAVRMAWVDARALRVARV